MCERERVCVKFSGGLCLLLNLHLGFIVYELLLCLVFRVVFRSLRIH